MRKRSDDVHSKNGHEQVSIQPIWEAWTGSKKSRADLRGCVPDTRELFRGLYHNATNPVQENRGVP